MKRLLSGLCIGASALLAGCARPAPESGPPGSVPVQDWAASAQYAQGIRLLVHESGTLNKPAEAYPWLLSAAKKGLPNAQAMVGLCLQKGWGVAVDEKEAEAWLLKSAEQGYSGAALLLAQICQGRGEADKTEAWLNAALARGNAAPEAYIMLATLYSQRGEFHKAVGLLRLAAMDGSPEAAYRMSRCYELGEGVPQDERLMLGWLKNAADMGHKGAKQRLRELKRKPARS